uniref:Uncharacterized protein n=1 Tax=Candidatus Kentrum sp. LFY TaxID=2126342 RepID=A0A450UQ15_9GAMM|nr:MAG: hypothetical protein BECKLFY1418A_GA0070994_104227 [Candidatus Kentron sp. LFY]
MYDRTMMGQSSGYTSDRCPLSKFLQRRDEAPNPAKPEPKFHRMEDMLALRAKTEVGWVLAGALVLSGFLFFRYLEEYVISTGGRCESRAFRAKS